MNSRQHFTNFVEFFHKFSSTLCYGPNELLSQDIDECAAGNAHECAVTQNCFNTFGSYECGCADGFVAGANETCIDVDECEVNPCQNSKECVNTERFFRQSIMIIVEKPDPELLTEIWFQSSVSKFDSKIRSKFIF